MMIGVAEGIKIKDFPFRCRVVRSERDFHHFAMFDGATLLQSAYYLLNVGLKWKDCAVFGEQLVNPLFSEEGQSANFSSLHITVVVEDCQLVPSRQFFVFQHKLLVVFAALEQLGLFHTESSLCRFPPRLPVHFAQRSQSFGIYFHWVLEFLQAELPVGFCFRN